jgi:feruloyl esterase
MKIDIFAGVVSCAIFVAVFPNCELLAQQSAQTTCEALAHVQAPNATITSATPVESASKIANNLTAAKAFCRVSGFLAPTSDSHIAFEVWLPPQGTWNHKFQGVGNGGFAGNVNVRAMMTALDRGYATMATDYGHINPPSNPVEDVSWAYQHPEKFIDYAYRAEHLTTQLAKQMIAAYYGSAPAHSYYTGCSAGGIQGMVEMLRYPTDYDGYVVGDATPDHLGQELAAFWNTMAASALSSPSDAFTPAQISLVHDAILKQCVGKDGGVGTDGFLTNPQACKFDPKSLQCAAGQDAAACVSPAQVALLDKIYQGPTDSSSHKQIIAALNPGPELGWDRYISGKKNPVGTERPWAGFVAYVGESDPDYLAQQKYLTFNWGSDLAAVRQRKIGDQTLDEVFNTTSRNLEPVKAEGGKVIHYHGWDDPNIPALEAVDFFNEVVADQAKRHKLTAKQAQDQTEQFYRLFMVPGMGHCNGGAGATAFGQGGRGLKDDPQYDTLNALEQWVEKGVAPDQFIGSRVDNKTGSVSMTRPICAYPKVPVWKGTGDTNDASNFSCAKKPQAQHASK